MAQTSKKTLADLVEILRHCYPSIPLTQKHLVALADSARMNQAHPKVVDLLVSICDANNPKFKEDLFRKKCNSN
jgi:endonuclease III